MTTVNDFTDILRIIREQPEWGDALRAALLSKEVLELPQRLAELTAAFTEFAESTNNRLSALEGDVTELKAGQARLEGDFSQLRGDFSRLEGRMGNSRGALYEIRVGKSISTTIARYLDLRRVRILKSHLVPENVALRDLMDAAQEQATITIEEQEEFDNIDLVLRGRGADQSAVYVVLEISVTAGDDDVHRAANRAEILRRATGETTVAAVVSANWDTPRLELAEKRDVAIVTKPEE